MLANLISHTLNCPVGKINIDNFHVVDIYWLYWASRYTIVIFGITERNDVTKRHGIVIIIWQMSAIEVTALSKTKGMQEKESIMGVRDR